ncbi:MAG TPA: serine protease [Vicinamibacterales bacterium]|nr:serine protease [Vicinamibacterales bacterium]
MSSDRRLLLLAFALSLALLVTLLSQRRIERQLAVNDAHIAELRDQMARSVLQARRDRLQRPLGTGGELTPGAVDGDGASSGPMIDEIKRQLQSEMGLLPPRLLRERRRSFVEVNATDASGRLRYGTAGHLGGGYFITVKHGVIALNESQDDRRVSSITILYKGRRMPARVVDSGTATVEVDPGDWAILRVRGEIDLPALQVDTEYPYEFAEPIFRLGNDYSKGILLSTGYIGQHMDNGLITSLTDGHPGVSGGGVLDQKGNLVGIPIGRMEGDYRFSFILPLRPEMFRKVPAIATTSR